MAAGNSKTIVGIVAVVVIIGLIIFALGSGQRASQPATTTSTGSASAGLPLMLTDPAAVPAGTQALVVDYSSVQVHTSGTSGSGWVSASGSGSVDLMGLVNASQVIGLANVSANSTINLIRLNVSSATITINGTKYNVTLPSSNITVAVTGKTKVNATSGVLLDLSPVVSAVFSNNSTTFVMAPSARATVVTNVSSSSRSQLGLKIALSARTRAEIDDVRPNVSISVASISVSGNVTTVSVTIKDNSNASVKMHNVIIYGAQNVTATGEDASAGANASLNANADPGYANGNLSVSITGNYGTGTSQSSDAGTQQNTSAGNRSEGVAANISAEDAIDGLMAGKANVVANARESEIADVGLKIRAFNVMNFVIAPGGNLTLVSDGAEAENSGYSIAPGASETFTFSGTLAYNTDTLQAKPVVGEQYTVVARGQEGANAVTNVTAT